MFSPNFITNALRASSTLSPDASLSVAKACVSAGFCSATTCAKFFANAIKSSFFATKSVSQLTSIIAPFFPSALINMLTSPSEATRPAALLALAPLLMRSKSSAAAVSPEVSVNAFLHSIMPRPVRSRRSLTIVAVISAMFRSLKIRLRYSKTQLHES